MPQTGRMSDQELLSGLVEAWWDAAQRTVVLLGRLDPQDWALPTDLPGWDVHDIAAHLAHLESVLAGIPEVPVEFEPGPHVLNRIGHFTESGVIARKDRDPADLIAEFRTSAATRHARLREDPPTDAAATPAWGFEGADWDTRTALTNRVIDLWMHNQDIRRTTMRPGDLDCLAAQITVTMFLRGVPVAFAKRAQAEPGTSMVFDVDGVASLTLMVDKNRRAQSVAEPLPQAPTLHLAMDAETFLRLCGGRGDAGSAVRVDGDQELARRVLAAMTMTM